MESPPAPGSDRRRPPTPSAAASPPNGNQAGAGNIASGSGTIAGSQSSVGESEGGQAAGPGVVDPKYPLWAADLVFIHSATRNKLTPARAADLVFTHNNHRLFSRNSQAYLTGPSRMWDIGGDGVESFGGVGMLEGADLSLDEPALEEEIIDSLT